MYCGRAIWFDEGKSRCRMQLGWVYWGTRVGILLYFFLHYDSHSWRNHPLIHSLLRSLIDKSRHSGIDITKFDEAVLLYQFTPYALSAPSLVVLFLGTKSRSTQITLLRKFNSPWFFHICSTSLSRRVYICTPAVACLAQPNTWQKWNAWFILWMEDSWRVRSQSQLKVRQQPGRSVYMTFL